MSEPMKRAGIFVIGLCTVAAGAGLIWGLLTSAPAPSAGRGVLLGLAALLVVPPAVIAALKAAGRTDRA